MSDAVTHRAAVLLLVVAPLALHAVSVGAAGALVARHRLGHDPLDHGARGRGHRLQAHLALDGGGVDGDAADGVSRPGQGGAGQLAGPDLGASLYLPVVSEPLLAVTQPVRPLPVQTQVVRVAAVLLTHLTLFEIYIFSEIARMF